MGRDGWDGGGQERRELWRLLDGLTKRRPFVIKIFNVVHFGFECSIFSIDFEFYVCLTTCNYVHIDGFVHHHAHIYWWRIPRGRWRRATLLKQSHANTACINKIIIIASNPIFLIFPTDFPGPTWTFLNPQQQSKSKHEAFNNEVMYEGFRLIHYFTAGYPDIIASFSV